MRFIALCLVLTGALIVGRYAVRGTDSDAPWQQTATPAAAKIDAIAARPILGGIAIVFGLLLLVMDNKTKDNTI